MLTERCCHFLLFGSFLNLGQLPSASDEFIIIKSEDTLCFYMHERENKQSSLKKDFQNTFAPFMFGSERRRELLTGRQLSVN